MWWRQPQKTSLTTEMAHLTAYKTIDIFITKTVLIKC